MASVCRPRRDERPRSLPGDWPRCEPLVCGSNLPLHCELSLRTNASDASAKHAFVRTQRDHAFLVQRDQICSKGGRTGITLTLPAEIGDEYCGNEYITHARTSAPKPRNAMAIAVLRHESPILLHNTDFFLFLFCLKR
jgi:hypothetical protein